MKYTEAKFGRMFVLRLEDGEIVHEVVEKFAAARRIKSGVVFAVGAADRGSQLVVGPARRAERPVRPMRVSLEDPHELSGVGTIFPDEKGRPVLHMHAAAGRRRKTTTGCVRAGVKVWEILEVVIMELKCAGTVRRRDATLGFALLSVGMTRK